MTNNSARSGGECAPPCASQETGTVRVVVEVTSPSQGSRAREPWPRKSPIALHARDWDGARPAPDATETDRMSTESSIPKDAAGKDLIFYAVLLFFPTLKRGAQQKTDEPVDHGGKLCSRSNQSSVGHPLLGSATRGPLDGPERKPAHCEL
ncbi:hypothetical protein PspLS_02094 [Pyricularia sp. CBS 133598]|nr:hypothetical protein PspLS_02094 [Pyricularia sp. CBS 133598]